jgi:membrane protein implicated in regulation of membrane protease activity
MKRTNKSYYAPKFTPSEVFATVVYLLFFMVISFASLAFPFQLITQLVHFSSWQSIGLYFLATVTLTPALFWVAYKIMQRIEAIEQQAQFRYIQQREIRRVKKQRVVNQFSY